jgi:hypothetical protein
MCSPAWEALTIDWNLLPSVAGVDTAACRTEEEITGAVRAVISWLRSRGCSYEGISYAYPFLSREVGRLLKELRSKPLEAGDTVVELPKTKSRREGVVVGFGQCNGQEQPLVLFDGAKQPQFSSLKMLIRL